MANWLAAIGQAAPDIRRAITDIQEGPLREERRRGEMERITSERRMRPFTEQTIEAKAALTKEQVEQAKMQTEKEKQEREFESRGWDPDLDPIAQKWLPEDREKGMEELKRMIPPNPQTGKWTQRDRKRFMNTLQESEVGLKMVTQFNINSIKNNIQKVNQQLAKVEEQGKTEDIQKYRVQIKQLTDKYNIELGNLDKITTAYEIKDLLGKIDESKMPEDVKESIQALGKIKDLDGIRDLLKEYVKALVTPGRHELPTEEDKHAWTLYGNYYRSLTPDQQKNVDRRVEKEARLKKEPVLKFKDQQLQKMWSGLTEDQKLRALGALPTDKELTDKDIVSAYTSIYTDADTREAIRPLYDNVMKRAGQKRTEAPKEEKGVKGYIDKALRSK